jgi:hypothetical protein
MLYFASDVLFLCPFNSQQQDHERTPHRVIIGKNLGSPLAAEVHIVAKTCERVQVGDTQRAMPELATHIRPAPAIQGHQDEPSGAQTEGRGKVGVEWRRGEVKARQILRRLTGERR